MTRPDFFAPPRQIEWCGIDELHPLPGQTATVQALRHLVQQYEGDAYAFVLTGPPGTGKSVLAAAVWQSRRDSEPKGCPPLPFIRWPALLRHLRGERAWWKAPEFVEACKADFAVADDLPAPGDDTEAEQFRVLVGERYDRHGHGCLSVTSNLSAKQILQHYGERTVDRLRDRTLWLVQAGESRRHPLTAAGLAKTAADMLEDEAEDAAT